jgi:hypothetical protein
MIMLSAWSLQTWLGSLAAAAHTKRIGRRMEDKLYVDQMAPGGWAGWLYLCCVISNGCGCQSYGSSGYRRVGDAAEESLSSKKNAYIYVYMLMSSSVCIFAGVMFSRLLD